MPHRLTVAALTAIAMGVGATPALAGTSTGGASPAPKPTPLVRAIDKVQDSLNLNLNEDLQTPAGERQEIHALVDHAAAVYTDTSRIAKIPAIKSQQKAKAEWLQGERTAAHLDVQMANAVYEILDGDPSDGYHFLNSETVDHTSFLINKLTSEAQRSLGVTG